MAESDHGRLTGTLAGPLLFLTGPLFGIGFGHFVPMSVLVTNGGEPINAHNWYLTVLAEQGIVGVVLVGALAVALVRALRSRPAKARTVGFAVLGCLAAQALFLEPPTSFQMLAAPAIVLVAALVGDWHEEPSDTADPEADRHAVAADHRIPRAAT
jgi:O-antigen ligase